LAIDRDGALYFGLTRGEVRKLTPEQTQETGLGLDDTEQVATLRERHRRRTRRWRRAVRSLAGGGGNRCLARADRRQRPDLFAAVGGFPNDVLHDPFHDRLLVTDSFGGAVYEVPLDADDPDAAASVWSDDDRLATDRFGANGLTFGTGAVYVAVTRGTNDAGDDVGRVVRVPLTPAGTPATPRRSWSARPSTAPTASPASARTSTSPSTLATKWCAWTRRRAALSSPTGTTASSSLRRRPRAHAPAARRPLRLQLRQRRPRRAPSSGPGSSQAGAERPRHASALAVTTQLSPARPNQT